MPKDPGVPGRRPAASAARDPEILHLAAPLTMTESAYGSSFDTSS
jgi:hypothetical protein